MKVKSKAFNWICFPLKKIKQRFENLVAWSFQSQAGTSSVCKSVETIISIQYRPPLNIVPLGIRPVWPCKFRQPENVWKSVCLLDHKADDPNHMIYQLYLAMNHFNSPRLEWSPNSSGIWVSFLKYSAFSFTTRQLDWEDQVPDVDHYKNWLRGSSAEVLVVFWCTIGLWNNSRTFWNFFFTLFLAEFF
jgi:hypothetical protein